MSQTVFARISLPLGSPEGKRSELWQRMELSSDWIVAPNKGSQKKGLFPRIRTEERYTSILEPPDAQAVTNFPETYDADRL